MSEEEYPQLEFPKLELVGRMCPECQEWSDDDDETCPNDCGEEGYDENEDEILVSAGKRFRIYRESDKQKKREPEMEFQYFENGRGSWYWRLVNLDNGKIVADGGEGYVSKANVTRAVDALNALLTEPLKVRKVNVEK